MTKITFLQSPDDDPLRVEIYNNASAKKTIPGMLVSICSLILLLCKQSHKTLLYDTQ
jgi:hypothetical protein